MPDESSAADEHALLREITAPLDTLPEDAAAVAADVDFPLVLRGYDRLAVDAYVKKTSQLVAELQATRSPEAAIRRAIERVGEQISGILQRAHDTAEQITTQSRREAENRLQLARDEGVQITAAAAQRVKDLDIDTDRIWAERQRIVDDARGLARQLLELADAAAERFPPADTEPPEDTDPPTGDTDPPRGDTDPPTGDTDPRTRDTDPPFDAESSVDAQPPVVTDASARPETRSADAAPPVDPDQTQALPIFERPEDHPAS